MAKYRKKPVIIEAFRYGIDDRPAWFKEAERHGSVQCFSQYGGDARWCEVVTLEGRITAQEGDWIIRGVQGEIYPCNPDIFALTYELAEED